MPKDGKIQYPIAYKWLSYLIVFAFAYYWLFTIAMIFIPKTTKAVSPRQAMAYSVFVRQNWHLFSTTKFYNRQLNLITRDRSNLRTDTIDLVNYFISQKRKYAPFNNYEDVLDRMLFQVMNSLEVQLQQKTAPLKKQFPNRPDSFYVQQSSLLVEQDSLYEVNMQNLANYAKYALQQKSIPTEGKEFRLVLIHKFIPPRKPQYSITPDSTSELLFISTFKNF